MNLKIKQSIRAMGALATSSMCVKSAYIGDYIVAYCYFAMFSGTLTSFFYRASRDASRPMNRTPPKCIRPRNVGRYELT